MIPRSAVAFVAFLLAALSAGWAGSAAADPLVVKDAWIRQPPPGANAAAYMSIGNPGTAPVRLVAVEAPAAERAELHRTVVEDDVARMSPVDAIEIPAGGTVTLAPRGFHLMLIRPRALAPAQPVELVLVLADGRRQRVHAEVRAAGRGGHSEHHGHHGAGHGNETP
jgi:copper(I)-binding protein